MNNNGTTVLWKGRMAKPWDNGIGYMAIGLTTLGKSVNLYVHRMVLQTFEPHKNFEKMEVNHIDGDKSNNRLENLEWVTSKENIRHAWDTGLMGIGEFKLGDVPCGSCGKYNKVSRDTGAYCDNYCMRLSEKVVQNRPDSDELYEMLKENTFNNIGRLYKVKGNTIKRWCKEYGIPHLASYYKKYK